MTTQGTWVRAITIGNGGTRADRTPEEQGAWADRVRRIEARADASMLRHGAAPEDLVRPHASPPSDGFRQALRSFFSTLTAEQKAAIVPASRGGDVTPQTVLDLWEGASVFPGGDQVRCFDEYVPIAEMLWPEEP